MIETETRRTDRPGRHQLEVVAVGHLFGDDPGAVGRKQSLISPGNKSGYSAEQSRLGAGGENKSDGDHHEQAALLGTAGILCERES